MTPQAPPFVSAQERFIIARNYIKGLVARYIRRFSYRISTSQNLGDMHWPSIDEVSRTAGLNQSIPPSTQWLEKHNFQSIFVIEQNLAAFEQHIERRIIATDAINKLEFLTPERIGSQFHLSDIEATLLCAIAAPQSDHDILRLYQFASGIDSQLFPGFFYADLLASEDYTQDDILLLLSHDHPLCTYSLIQCRKEQLWDGYPPSGVAQFNVPERILSFLIGTNTTPSIDYARFISVPTDTTHATATQSLIFDSNFVRQATKQLKRRKARVLFIGPKGFGRRSFIRQYAKNSNVSILEIDISQLVHDNCTIELLRIIGLWFREARLMHSIMLFRCDNIPEEDIEKSLLKVSSKFYQLVDQFSGTICILSQERFPLITSLFGTCAEVICQLPTRSAQFSMWQNALAPYVDEDEISNIAQYVSTSYRLTMGEIKKTIETCRNQHASKILTGPQLAETLRITRGQELTGLADLKATPIGLDNIILCEKTSAVIEEILNYARYSEFVFDEWGFSKVSNNVGLSVLFSGPPGTGKTLTASAIAHELRCALYVVDVSRVVDRYIGETEKKLAKIFNHAQKSQAILLFDEADSLFAKRTSVKSSNDRYANLEVNYLLQRLETYPGMTILTTNQADSLDDALARRIQFKVVFDMPTPHERSKIWHALLPRVAQATDIDFTKLGNSFEMSGGHIKNAVFRACINAASQNTSVTTAMLWNAAILEYRALGHVICDGFTDDSNYN